MTQTLYIIIVNNYGEFILSQVIYLSMLHILSHLFFTVPHNETGTINIMPILQMRKLNHREIK